MTFSRLKPENTTCRHSGMRTAGRVSEDGSEPPAADSHVLGFSSPLLNPIVSHQSKSFGHVGLVVADAETRSWRNHRFNDQTRGH